MKDLKIGRRSFKNTIGSGGPAPKELLDKFMLDAEAQ